MFCQVLVMLAKSKVLILQVFVKARFPVLYGKYSTRGVVEKAIQHEAKPSAVWLSRPHLECCISRTAQGNRAFTTLWS